MIEIRTWKKPYLRTNAARCFCCGDTAAARMIIGEGFNEYAFWLCVDHLNTLRSEATDAWGSTVIPVDESTQGRL